MNSQMWYVVLLSQKHEGPDADLSKSSKRRRPEESGVEGVRSWECRWLKGLWCGWRESVGKLTRWIKTEVWARRQQKLRV